MSRLVLLDFDGVVNAISAKPDRNVHPDWLTTVIDGYPILAAKRVIDYFNELSHVDVLWLTTWESSSSLFHDAIGIAKFDYVPAPPGVDIRLPDWKVDAGLEMVDRYDMTLWIDDHPLFKSTVDDRRVTHLTPNSHIGLSKKNLRAIDDFCS